MDPLTMNGGASGMQIAVTGMSEIPNAPEWRQVSVTVNFPDASGSVLHTLSLSMRVEGKPTDPVDLIERRALQRAKQLAREFADSPSA